MIGDISRTFEHDWDVVRVRGELDLALVPAFQSALRAAEAAATKGVMVDLAEVDLIDSPSLGVLLGHRRRARAMSVGSVLVASSSVRRLLDLTGTTAVFQVYDDIDAAIGA